MNSVVVDDFESTAAGEPPDPALWSLKLTSGATIGVSDEQAYGGTKSVKVVSTSGSTMMINSSAFPLPDGVVYFRAWARFANADWANHIGFAAAGPGDESQEVRFGGQQGAYHANLAADGDGVTPDPWEFPECSLCVAPVADQWVCLRGKLDFSNNAVQLYVGETLAVDANSAEDWHAGTGTLPANPTQLGFGWAVYGGMGNTVYYDDIAIGYEPLACD